MSTDLPAASSFMATHARLLDRRRFESLFGGGRPEHGLAAVEVYQNADGGYGWGLEPDLRASESQPGGALHALEVFEEVAPLTNPRASELCDWLASVSLDDGGLPFALPVADAAGCAPFWAEADATTSSLHITTAVAAAAHRVARHDPAVAGHPWLARATRYCLDEIAGLAEMRHAIELHYAIDFLDTLADTDPEAAAQLDRLAKTIPASGSVPVGGGDEYEMMRPLDFAPLPDRPIRRHFAPEVIEADLDRLAGLQGDDGGWVVDFTAYSPQATLEWRGYATVHALKILRANGRLA